MGVHLGVEPCRLFHWANQPHPVRKQYVLGASFRPWLSPIPFYPLLQAVPRQSPGAHLDPQRPSCPHQRPQHQFSLHSPVTCIPQLKNFLRSGTTSASYLGHWLPACVQGVFPSKHDGTSGLVAVTPAPLEKAIFLFFWRHRMACGWDLSFPDQGSNPRPLHYAHRVLTTGPPGKSPFLFFKVSAGHSIL